MRPRRDVLVGSPAGPSKEAPRANRARPLPIASVSATLAAALGLFAVLSPPAPPEKKLLQWGWDEPDTAYLRAHLPKMEESPFDGCIFGVRYGEGGRGGSFSWQAWGRRRFTDDDLASAFADLRTLRPRRFSELFLRLNVTPGDVGWFQDYSAIVSNARLAARLARAGRARGVLIDVEQYQAQLFDFRRQPMAEAYGWAAYAAQARRRGREVMTAFQEGYPGLTVFLTFGYTLPWVLSDKGQQPLAETPYGLLASFLDGMLEAGEGCTRLIDGFELSYGYRHSQNFTEARRLFREVHPIVRQPSRYRARLQLGFGLWLDYDWRRLGWSPTEVEKNYFTPTIFGASLRAALQESDRYVWVYAETPRWWDGGSRAGLPTPYAVVLGRAHLAALSPRR